MNRDQEGSRDSRVQPGAGHLAAQGHAPTVVIAGPDGDAGEDRVLVSSPAGRSESRVRVDGELSVVVEGGDPGRPGEATVVRILVGKLRQLGIECRSEVGVDHHGDDAILVVGDLRITIQVVTLLVDQDFWREAKRRSTSRQMTADQAAGALQATIEKKGKMIRPSQAPTLLLAIDARHAASLVSESVLRRYAALAPAQILDYGFASVWVVGPTAVKTSHLGGQWP